MDVRVEQFMHPVYEQTNQCVRTSAYESVRTGACEYMLVVAAACDSRVHACLARQVELDCAANNEPNTVSVNQVRRNGCGETQTFVEEGAALVLSQNKRMC